jgi:prepilin-type N-terminal cleavage/methylation domain-containing protein
LARDLLVIVGMGFTAPNRPTLFRPSKTVGFTLMEVMVAASILALFIVGAVSTMAQINRWAASARLRTLATSLVQQRIDQIMTVPWSTTDAAAGKTPTVLTTGKTTESSLPLNNDSLNNQTGLSSAYTNLDVQVIDKRVTDITVISARLLRADVTVSYTYRSHGYTISMSTLRTTDDF